MRVQGIVHKVPNRLAALFASDHALRGAGDDMVSLVRLGPRCRAQ